MDPSCSKRKLQTLVDEEEAIHAENSGLCVPPHPEKEDDDDQADGGGGGDLDSQMYYDVEPNDAGVFGKKFKPTLDSDEEDDEEKAQKYNVMSSEVIEGQEEATTDREGDIKISAFNMREEMDEGYFDKEGTYIFKKDDEVRDGWLDNLDKMPASEFAKPPGDDEEDSQPEEPFNIIQAYKDIIELLESNEESIETAIRRLGKLSNPPRTKQHKGSQTTVLPPETKAKAREAISKLTSLADRFMTRGDMNIYQKKKSLFVVLVKKHDHKEVPSDSGDDIFSDNFVPKKKMSHERPSTSSQSQQDQEEDQVESEQILWEFKWENSDKAEVYGPYSSGQMLSWSQSSYFDKGVWARQTTKRDGPFYTSKRIDFDLYV